jgi:hypothetical protein
MGLTSAIWSPDPASITLMFCRHACRVPIRPQRLPKCDP